MIYLKATRKCFICGEEKEITLRSAIVRPYWPNSGINSAEISWDYDGDDVSLVGGIACRSCYKKRANEEPKKQESWLSRLFSVRGKEEEKTLDNQPKFS